MIKDLFISLKAAFYPNEAFQELKSEYEGNETYKFKWLIPFIIIAILLGTVQFLLIPQEKKYMPAYINKIIQSQPNITPEKADKTMKMTIKGLTIQPFFAWLGVLIAFLFTTLFLYIYLYFFNLNLSFKKLWAIAVISYFPQIYGTVLSFFYHFFTKFKFIQSLQDFKRMSLGFQLILKHNSGFLANFLAVNNFPTLWALFITIVGISIFSNKKISKIALIIIIPWSIISVLFAMLMGLQG
ncbi:YIP1 family protein [bacterium]|nr:YIP1 family protein [bacterium]